MRSSSKTNPSCRPPSPTEARRGDGWIKLVGDWIDRSVGDLAPLWSDDVLKAAIDAAHDNGARVTAHVFSEDALPGLINAGIDCIEHGTGLTDDTIALMLEHGTVLVPTLINIENFPGIAAAASRYPTYAAHMRDLYARCQQRIAAARDAGVPMYAGSDAGSMVAARTHRRRGRGPQGHRDECHRGAGRGVLGRSSLAGPARSGSWRIG